MEETTTIKRRRRRRNVDAESSVDTVDTQVAETTDEDIYALFGLTKEPATEKAEKSEKAETEKSESGAAEIKKEVKSKAKQAKKIEVGATYELPFTRLYQSSVAKLPICVCSGAVEIISDEIHDGRINVLNHGTKLKGWIDVTEI